MSDKPKKILEIGPGKGYFFDAIQNLSLKNGYFAMDRNSLVLDNLESVPKQNKIKSDVNDFPKISVKFDLIYSAYLIEHLNNGHEIFKFVQNCKEILEDNGKLILLAPDSMRAKTEFWNIDYTHIFPTTPRNIYMALNDAGYQNIRVYPINGLLTVPGFRNPLIYLFIKFLFYFYNYKIYNRLLGWLFSTPLYSIDNFFYRAYSLVQQENMIVFAEKNRKNE